MSQLTMLIMSLMVLVKPSRLKIGLTTSFVTVESPIIRFTTSEADVTSSMTNVGGGEMETNTNSKGQQSSLTSMPLAIVTRIVFGDGEESISSQHLSDNSASSSSSSSILHYRWQEHRTRGGLEMLGIKIERRSGSRAAGLERRSRRRVKKLAVKRTNSASVGIGLGVEASAVALSETPPALVGTFKAVDPSDRLKEIAVAECANFSSGRGGVSSGVGGTTRTAAFLSRGAEISRRTIDEANGRGHSSSRNVSVSATNLSGVAASSTSAIEDEEQALQDSLRYERLLCEFRALYPTEHWKNCCLYNDDFLRTINPHWLQFDPPSQLSHYILATLYAVIMVIGLFGNYLVIFMFLRCRSLQTPANILVANLAVSDFLLLSKMPVFIFNSFQGGPALGEAGCQIYGFVGGLTGTVSIMTLAAIALDRYLVVVYPLNPFKNTTRQRARICVGFVWLYGLVFSFIPLLNLGLNRYVPEGYLTACSFDYLATDQKSRTFILVYFVAAWLVPFIIITFCYVSICRAVVRTKNVSRFGQEKEKRRVELRLAIVVVFVIALWFVSWTPYAIVALLGFFRQTQFLSPSVSMIPALFCKTASCADPYIYAITNPKFKKELFRLFDKNYQSKSKLSKHQTGTTCRNKTTSNNRQIGTLDETTNNAHTKTPVQYPSTFNSSSED